MNFKNRKKNRAKFTLDYNGLLEFSLYIRNERIDRERHKRFGPTRQCAILKMFTQALRWRLLVFLRAAQTGSLDFSSPRHCQKSTIGRSINPTEQRLLTRRNSTATTERATNGNGLTIYANFYIFFHVTKNLLYRLRMFNMRSLRKSNVLPDIICYRNNKFVQEVTALIFGFIRSWNTTSLQAYHSVLRPFRMYQHTCR